MGIKPGLPLKIAFFHIMAGSFSGAAKNIFRLLRRIDPAKLDCVLVGQAQYELIERTRALGVKTSIVPFPPSLDIYGQRLLRLTLKEIIRTLAGVWEYNVSLMRYFKEIRPQVIWADNIRTFFTLYCASKLSGCKVIWNIWSEPEGKVAWTVHRLGLILADVINLEYEAQAAKLFGGLARLPYFKSKLITLYTGVTDFEESTGNSIRAELKSSPTDILILMAGNISPAKGQMDLLHAMEELVKESPQVHLLLAGQPLGTHSASVTYDRTLRSYVSEKGLSRNVHFLGWRSDMPDLFKDSDIYVSSSYSESFPDAVREAMWAGKACVATNVGGTFELVAEAKSGYLFNPGDVRSLIGHLTRLIRDPEIRTSMGKEGKRIIQEHFSTERYARQFEHMVLLTHLGHSRGDTNV